MKVTEWGLLGVDQQFPLIKANNQALPGAKWFIKVGQRPPLT